MLAAVGALAFVLTTAGMALVAPAARAQGAEASTPAKKELVARVLKLQQPGVENLGRTLAEQPAMQLAAPVRAAIARLPQDKRDAVAQQIEADVRRYAEEVVPIVRDRAVALAPATIGPMLEQRFTEDELRQLVAILESPINARYQALGLEMQRALGMKLVAETRAAVDPKYKALEQSIQSRLRLAFAAAGAASGPGGGPGGGSGAAGPGLRASGPGN